jgi:hypothetical protein
MLAWPLTNEVFLFDQDGLHQETRTLLTDARVFSFTYDDRKRLRQMLTSRRSSLEIKHLSEDSAEILVDGRVKNRLRANRQGLIASVDFLHGQITRKGENSY